MAEMINDLHERLVLEIRGSTGKDHRKLANNTYGRIDGDCVTIRLHNTDIAEIWSESAEYNTGGWFTVTTKERINHYLPQGWRVHSERSIWYLTENHGKRSRFYDGITLSDTTEGVKIDDPRLDDPDADLRKAIDRYVKLYTDERLTELVDQAIASGSNGDCLFCQLDHPGGGDHLALHVAEGYTMVTLAANAVKRAGYRPEIYIRGMASDSNWHDGTTIRRCIRKMMKAELLNKGIDFNDLMEEVNA